MSTSYKPLCPCCLKAYTSSILEGDNNITAGSSSSDNNNSPFILCGTCEPSDIEKALASKAESDPSVPPIVWLLTPEEIEQTTQQILSNTTANLDAIAAVPLSEVTFDNTIAKLMCPPNYKTNPQVASVKFLQHCSTDSAMREAASNAGKLLSKSRVMGRMRKDAYERVRAFSQTNECNELDEYKKHFVTAALQDFERAGLALSDEDSTKLQSSLEEDAAVCSEYGKNLGSDNTKLFFTPEELKGCTEDFINDRLGKDEEGTTCTITLKYPDIIPIGQTCDVASTRKAVAEAREGTMAYKNNLDLVAKGIQLRKEISSLLGYDSWAEYICSKRMSGSYQAVDDFLSNLQTKLTTAGKEDYNRLLTLKEHHCAEAGLDFDGKLNAWDTAFYDNLLLKTEYGVDVDKIKEYFPLDHVVETTLLIYQELLGLTFEELPKGTYWSWHKDVRCFQVKDSASGNLIGHFYLDLHPREGKYGHAAIFHLVKHNTNHGAVDCMLCNLPASTQDRPSLLRHSNVVTFFHEVRSCRLLLYQLIYIHQLFPKSYLRILSKFGHIMHGLCSEGIGNSTRLAKCPRDFVEAPSQMLENWCWQKVILERLSKHYQTGAPLPDGKLQSMIRAKHVNVAFGSLRQIYLSRLDLEIHGTDPPTSATELQQLVDNRRPSITLIQNPPGNNMLRTFGHLMNQYSASYYGYMWAEVLSADMFATRFEKDVMNSKAGMDYRKMVLAPGGTHSITDHLTTFLGRKPNNVAFLKSRGILE